MRFNRMVLWFIYILFIQVYVNCLMDLSPQRYIKFVAPGNDVSINCTLNLSQYNCTNHCHAIGVIIWEFHDIGDVSNKRNITVDARFSSSHYNTSNYGKTLTIYNFTKALSGEYSCYSKFKTDGFDEAVLRGLNIHLYDRPKLKIKPMDVTSGDTAVLECFDWRDSFQSSFDVKWFKNDILLQETSSIKFYRNILVILSANYSWQGEYKCEVTFGTFMKSKYTSEKVRLSVIEGAYEHTTPYIYHNEGLWEGDTLFLICVAHGNVSWSRRLNNKSKVVLAENSSIVIYEKRNVQVEDRGRYTCKVEQFDKKIKKKVDVEVYNDLIYDNNGIKVISTKKQKEEETVDYTYSCNIKKKWLKHAQWKWYFNNQYLHESNNKSSYTSNLTGVYQCIVLIDGISQLKTWIVQDTTQTSSMMAQHVMVSFDIDYEYHILWRPPENTAFKFEYKISIDCNINDDDDDSKIYRIPKQDNYYIGGCKQCAGRVCKYEVCTFDVRIPDLLYCDFAEGKMLSKPPLIGPSLKRPIVQHDKLTLTWSDPDFQYLNGAIKRYRIYLISLFDQKVNYRKQYDKPPDGSREFFMDIPYEGEFIIYLTLLTSFAESPSSVPYFVHYNEGSPRKDKTHSVKLISKESIPSLSNSAPYVTWDVDVLGVEISLHGFILYFTPIPFQDFWDETKIIQVGKETREYTLDEYLPSVSYRISVVPIFTEKLSRQDLQYMTSGKFMFHTFFPNKTLLTNILKQREASTDFIFDVLYKSFGCVSLSQTSILFTWQVFPKNRKKTFYLRLINGITQEEKLYMTTESLFEVGNLHSKWYHAILGFQHNNKTHYTNFITCLTRHNVPSPVRNVSYSFIYDYVNSKMFLQLKFKQPAVTSNSTYYYLCTATGVTNHDLVPWYFDAINQPLIVDRRQQKLLKKHDLLVMKPFVVEMSSTYHLKIIARNDMGDSEPVHVETIKTFEPLLSKLEKRNENEAASGDKDDDVEDDGSEIAIGITIGVTVSLTLFLTMLVAICLYKYFKRKEIYMHDIQHLLPPSNDEPHQFLYLEKLQQVRESGAAMRDDNTSVDSISKAPNIVCLPFSKIRYSHPLKFWSSESNNKCIDESDETGSPLVGCGSNSIHNHQKSESSFSQNLSNQHSEDNKKFSATASYVDRRGSPRQQSSNKGDSSSFVKDSSSERGLSSSQCKDTSTLYVGKKL